MKVFRAILLAGILLNACLPLAHAQAVVPDKVTFEKAKVVDVLSSKKEEVPATGTTATYQKIEAQILEGEDAGKTLELDNDYMSMQKGDVFYVTHTISGVDGTETYAVSEPYRLPILLLFVGIFLVCLVVFGGKQGVRGLISLVASFFFIWYLLLPGILNGYSPILVSMGVSSLIIVLGSYITHGFTKTTTSAVVGMILTIVVTGALAYGAVHWGKFSGFTTQESVYLNFDTKGAIDFVGLLLGSIMIGLLGVLYDAAIGQAVAVEELLHVGKYLEQGEIFKRALRIGREHIGALVNTLAIAYVGASLPLLLLFKLTAAQSPLTTINQELFASEIIRVMIGSTGIILAVPITTAVAIWILSRNIKLE
jgi:uncharacterized membrane protein